MSDLAIFLVTCALMVFFYFLNRASAKYPVGPPLDELPPREAMKLRLRRDAEGNQQGAWHGRTVTVLRKGGMSLSAPELPPGFELTRVREPPGDPVSWPLEEDVAFDSIYPVPGPEDVALAVLRDPLRRALAEGAPWKPYLRDGCVRSDLSAADEASRLACLNVLSNVLRAWRAPQADIREDLADNVRTERVPARAMRNLKYLLEHHPDWPGTAAARSFVLSSPRGDLRLAASKLFPAEAPALLAGIARDTDVAGPLRRAAIDALVADFPAVAEREVPEMLRSDDELLQCLALSVIQVHRSPRAVREVVPLLGARADDTVIAAARVLETLRATEAETPLLEALTTDNDSRRLAIVSALGRVGGIDSVEPLLSLVRHGGDLAEEARQAARMIQARLGHPDAGRVALAGSDLVGGGVSLASGGADGSVSLVSSPIVASGESPESSVADPVERRRETAD